MLAVSPAPTTAGRIADLAWAIDQLTDRVRRGSRGLVGRARRLWELSTESSAPLPVPPSEPPLLAWPLDHFYSPVPDHRALGREPTRSRVWPATPNSTPGIEWRGDDQLALLREGLAGQEAIWFAAGPTGDPTEYHAANGMFSRLDAWMLQGILRQFRPRRMIEVGCGWSSLVTARVNREFLNGELHFTCIEPYPPEFLSRGVRGISELVVSPVEALPVDAFLELGRGDVLFIDSSHTVKTGGDVQFLFEEVIPRLADGVLVHVHDIFLPWDYPRDWVVAGRAWNEQYVVHAFLAFNAAFRVLLSVGWLRSHHPDALAAALPDYPASYPDAGGSLWFQRAA